MAVIPEEPRKEEPTSKSAVQVGRTTRKTIGIPTDIGDVKSRLAYQEETAKNEVEKVEKQDLNFLSYTQDELENAWNAFIDMRKEKGSEQEVALLKHKFECTNDVVKIQIHNSILEITYDKIKVELQSHLRKRLKNDSIRVELEKLESESKKMLYTNKEKFDHLAAKHPAIKLLQEKLSLDPDY